MQSALSVPRPPPREAVAGLAGGTTRTRHHPLDPPQRPHPHHPPHDLRLLTRVRALSREMREDARMDTAKPRQSLTGVVSADEERVWDALLETSPYLTPRMREMITGSHGVLRFPAVPADGQTETSPVPGVNVEADGGSRTLAVSGQWWFRGVYSMIPHGPET